jgi:glycosyltransferase involved in cell wall biosynthesis
MKLIIQIPCFNEAETLEVTLNALPKKIDGIDTIEILIIDDGSSDRTVEVARNWGVDHIVSHPKNRGLSRAFMTGLEESVLQGADIIVNTDADNQYHADDIVLLIEPITAGRAEMVIGERPISTTAHFSPLKKLLQKIGSKVVRMASNTCVPDAPSGFRAFGRQAAKKLHVFNEYTYTLETIIQAGQKGIAIESVPVRTNEDLRESRLVKNIRSYVLRSMNIIIRVFMTYKPFPFFAVPGMIFFLCGFLLGVRFLVFFFLGDGEGHIQSVVLSASLITIGLFVTLTGLIADLISVNRKLLENIDWRVKSVEERLRR